MFLNEGLTSLTSQSNNAVEQDLDNGQRLDRFRYAGYRGIKRMRIEMLAYLPL